MHSFLPHRIALAVAAGFAGWAGLAESAPVEAGTAATVLDAAAGVLVLEEVWDLDAGELGRSGSGNGTDRLAVFRDLVVDGEGVVHLLDPDAARVWRVAPDGTLLEDYAAGAGGEPRGERDPSGPAARVRGLAAVDGDRIAVLVGGAEAWALHDSSGRHLGPLAPPVVGAEGGSGAGTAAAAEATTDLVTDLERRGRTTLLATRAGRFVDGVLEVDTTLHLAGSGTGEDAPSPAWTVVARSTRVFDPLRPVIREVEADPFRWALAPDGSVYLSSGFEGRIDRLRPDGVLHDVVHVQARPLARDAAARARVRARLLRGGAATRTHLEIEAHDRTVRWMDVDAAGRLWVQTARGAAAADADSLGVFEVFADGGRHWEVELRGDGDPWRDLFRVVGDRLIVLRGAAEADPGAGRAPRSGVVAYRLPDPDTAG